MRNSDKIAHEELEGLRQARVRWVRRRARVHPRHRNVTNAGIGCRTGVLRLLTRNYTSWDLLSERVLTILIQ